MRATLSDEIGVSNLVHRLEDRRLSGEVLQALREQNLVAGSPTKCSVLKRLSDSPLFVFTGQQVGLYGGPLLTLYKAVTAIKVANFLSGQLKRVVLPIFWLQTEDHDLEEISSTTILTHEGEPKKLSLDPQLARSNRRSVGSIKLSEEISTLNLELTDLLSFLPNSKTILELITSAYSGGESWSGAFHRLYLELFRDTDLLFFDLNKANLKSLHIVKEIFRGSISNQERIEASLIECTNRHSISNGVSLKPGSPLVFVSDLGNNRFRLTLDRSGFYTAGTQASLKFTREELLSLVDSAPERFSSSALLRPILQDALFPTIAYVGGNAELQYHRQIDSLYSEFNLTPPLLLSREKYRLMSRKIKHLVDEIGLPLQTFLDTNEVIGEKLRSVGHKFGIDTSLYLEQVKFEVERLSSQFTPLVKEIDATLEEPLKKTTANAINGYTNFLSRLTKASIQKDSVTLNRIQKIRAQIFPFGIEQEREMGVVSVLARTGIEFVELICNQPLLPDGSIRELVID